VFAWRRMMIFNVRFTWPKANFTHDATPVPAQAPWLPEATNNVQQHAAKSSLANLSFIRSPGESRRCTRLGRRQQRPETQG